MGVCALISFIFTSPRADCTLFPFFHPELEWKLSFQLAGGGYRSWPIGMQNLWRVRLYIILARPLHLTIDVSAFDCSGTRKRCVSETLRVFRCTIFQNYIFLCSVNCLTCSHSGKHVSTFCAHPNENNVPVNLPIRSSLVNNRHRRRRRRQREYIA